MNSAIFWRVFWKEYRTQRAFWICWVVLTAAMLWILSFSASGDAQSARWILRLALALPAFYAAGCGGTLFAAEHESGTFHFQQALPVSWWPVFFAKATFAVASTALMMGVLWLGAVAATGGRLPATPEHLGVWALWGTAATELFVWTMFFSLLLHRPLTAAVLGIAAGSFGMHAAASAITPHYFALQAEPYIQAIPLRLAVVVVIAVFDVCLGSRWLRDTEERPEGFFGTWRRNLARRRERKAVLSTSQSGGEFGRLVWQQWRQSAGMFLVLGLLTVVLFVFGVVLLRGRHSLIDPRHRMFTVHGRTDTMVLLQGITIVVLPLAGVSVFWSDWRHGGHRFLVERGVRPSLFWLTRHLVWILPLALWELLLVAVFLFPGALRSPLTRHIVDHAMPDEESQRRLSYLGLTSGVCVLASVGMTLAYTAGQLCSLLFRSGVLAGFLSFLVGGLVLAWGGFMLYTGVPWIWSVLPIPFIFLLASWLRARGALLERNTWRAWLAPGVVLALPTVALLIAAPTYRVYSVSLVSPGFSPQQYARPATAEERVTVRMYERAWALYDVKRNMPPEEESSTAQKDSNTDGTGSQPPEPGGLDLEWVERHRAALELALKASRRADADFFASNSFRSSAEGHAAVMGHELRAAGRVLCEAGQLEKALEYYSGALRVARHLRQRNRWQEHIDHLEKKVHYAIRGWAGHPKQTADSILAAINRIDAIDNGIPPRETAIKNRYLFARRAVNADQDALADLIDGKLLSEHEAFQTYLWSRCLPWERARAVRVLNRITAEQLRRWRRAAEHVELGRRWHYPDQQPRLHVAWNDDVESLTFPITELYQPFADAQIRGLMEMETERRATHLILALLAWKLEHGELPRSLEALEGDLLESLSVDPFTGEAFRYFPEGLSVNIRWSRERRSYDTVPANQPFVWSAGSKLGYRPRESPLLRKFYIKPRRFPHTYLTHPTSEIELWQSGWLFPVP